MKHTLWLALIFLLTACEPQTPTNTITLIDGESYRALPASSRIPAEIFAENGILLASADRILVNGQIVDAAVPMITRCSTYRLPVHLSSGRLPSSFRSAAPYLK